MTNEEKRAVCFRVRCCRGGSFFWGARLFFFFLLDFISLVNKLQECDANDSVPFRLIWLFFYEIISLDLFVDVATD